jgi:hypothetical protein
MFRKVLHWAARVAAAMIVLQAGVACAQQQRYFGAIAYSDSTGRWGLGHDQPYLEAAERMALYRANSPDARIVCWCTNGWCSFAHSNTGPASGIGWGETVAEAQYWALRDCQSQLRYGEQASVVANVYSGVPRPYSDSFTRSPLDNVYSPVPYSPAPYSDVPYSPVPYSPSAYTNTTQAPNSRAPTRHWTQPRPGVWYDGLRTRVGL